jgi:hypothetical protein
VQLVSFERATGAPRARASIAPRASASRRSEGVTQGRGGSALIPPTRCRLDRRPDRALAVRLAAKDVGAPEAERTRAAGRRAGLRAAPAGPLARRSTMDWVERAVARYDAPT